MATSECAPPELILHGTTRCTQPVFEAAASTTAKSGKTASHFSVEAAVQYLPNTEAISLVVPSLFYSSSRSLRRCSTVMFLDPTIKSLAVNECARVQSRISVRSCLPGRTSRQAATYVDINQSSRPISRRLLHSRFAFRRKSFPAEGPTLTIVRDYPPVRSDDLFGVAAGEDETALPTARQSATAGYSLQFFEDKSQPVPLVTPAHMISR